MTPHRTSFVAIAILVLVPGIAWAGGDDAPIQPPDIPTTSLPPEDAPVDPGKPAPAEAPDVVAAREFERRAQELFDEGKYDDAIGFYRKAEARRPDPSHDVGVARALAKLGKLLEAREVFRKLTGVELPPNAPSSAVDAQAAAEDGARALEPRIPKLDVAVRTKKGARFIVRLDGAAIDPKLLAAPIQVDPGPHAIEVEPTRGGGSLVKRSVTAREGQTERVLVDLRPPPGFDVQKLAPYAIGLGVIGLGLGGVTGGLSLAKVSDVKSRCVEGHCPSTDQSKADSARTLGTVSTVGFVLGGALAVAGVVLIAWPSTHDGDAPVSAPAPAPGSKPAPAPKTAAFTLGVGPGSVLVGGSF